MFFEHSVHDEQVSVRQAMLSNDNSCRLIFFGCLIKVMVTEQGASPCQAPLGIYSLNSLGLLLTNITRIHVLSG